MSTKKRKPPAIDAEALVDSIFELWHELPFAEKAEPMDAFGAALCATGDASEKIKAALLAGDVPAAIVAAHAMVFAKGALELHRTADGKRSEGHARWREAHQAENAKAAANYAATDAKLPKKARLHQAVQGTKTTTEALKKFLAGPKKGKS